MLLQQLRLVLRQVRALQDDIRRDLETRTFSADDVRMQTYNDLCSIALGMMPDDDVFKTMIVMPDASLQRGFGGNDTATMRLEGRLTRLANRIELILGDDSGDGAKPRESPQEVLSSERDSPELGQILAKLSGKPGQGQNRVFDVRESTV